MNVLFNLDMFEVSAVNFPGCIRFTSYYIVVEQCGNDPFCCFFVGFHHKKTLLAFYGHRAHGIHIENMHINHINIQTKYTKYIYIYQDLPDM